MPRGGRGRAFGSRHDTLTGDTTSRDDISLKIEKIVAGP